MDNMGLQLMKYILSESKNEKIISHNRSTTSFGKDYVYNAVLKITKNDKEFIK